MNLDGSFLQSGCGSDLQKIHVFHETKEKDCSLALGQALGGAPYGFDLLPDESFGFR